LLPFGAGTLVGTTDIPFEGDPATVVASEQEVEYLLSVVADVFPSAGLSRADITMHKYGVRPLPYVDAKTPAAITRRHQLVWNEESKLPLLSLVGGKLTTCRSLAEETAAAILNRLDRKVEQTSRERPIPPTDVDDGLRAPGLPLKSLPSSLIEAAIKHEWVTRLEDLVERRLMLHFSPELSRQALADLANALVQHGKLAFADVPATIDRCTTRLKTHFGIQLTTDN
jgi:glycerol-3-phosphate dehydrogenase